MAPARASLTLKTTREMIDITIVDTGIFIGAVFLLVDADVLLPPTPETR